jgi:serine/threonine protein kinase
LSRKSKASSLTRRSAAIRYPAADVASVSSLDPRLAALTGRRIADRYLVGQPLGVGGMGAVFRAEQLKLKRAVAIKVLNPDSSEHADGRMRFAREAESAARLDHENCVQVYDFGTTEDGIHYMVMPILSGQSVGEAHRFERCSPERVLRLGAQLFAGLEHAHSRGVIHRDLKPDNLFLVQDENEREVLKIVDFGIAKIVEGSDGPETQKGLLYGTPAYMSPEQAAGDPIDPRSDLFSAGLILYRLLMGSLPGRAKTALDQMRKRATQEIPPLPALVPEELREFVAKLLCLDKEARIASAGEARERCEAILAHWRDTGEDWDLLLEIDDDPTEEDIPFSAPTDGTAITEREQIAARSWLPIAAGATAIGCFALAWASLSPARQAEDKANESSAVLSANATAKDSVQPSTAEKIRPPKVDPPTDAAPTPKRNSLQELALVNERDPQKALPFEERHEVFARLEADPNTRSLLDHRTNLAMDLYQASTSEAPCDTYATTLRTIETSKDAFFLEAVESAAPPRGETSCEALEGERKRVLESLRGRPVTPEPEVKRPTKPSTSAATRPEPTAKPPVNPQGSVTDKLDG